MIGFSRRSMFPFLEREAYHAVGFFFFAASH